MGRFSTVHGLTLAALLLAAPPAHVMADAGLAKTIFGRQSITLAQSSTKSSANLPPRAVATATTLSVSILQTVNFDGTQSRDPEGAPLYFQWSFSDGSEPSNDPSPAHVFDAPGIYNVVLVVVDELGLAGTAALAIRVGLDGPNAVPNPPRFPYSPLGSPG